MSKDTHGTKMMKTNQDFVLTNKQIYGKTFSSKKELIKWLEENGDKIDWDLDEPELNFYYKDGER